MPKAKPAASLSGLVDTVMEDDTLNMDAFPTPDSNQENAGSARKKGRPTKATGKKLTKTKVIGRRTSGDSIPPQKPAPKRKAAPKRAPLKEQTNVQHAEDTEEVDEFAKQDIAMDELAEVKQPAKRKAPPKKTAKKTGKQSKKEPEQTGVAEKEPAQQLNAVEKDGEFEYTPTTTRQTKRLGRSAAQKPKANVQHVPVEPRQQEKIIPETQVAMEIDQSEVPEEDEGDEDAVPQSVFRPTKNAREKTNQRQPTVARRRAGSASDNERASSDPATRRKLGEMTKKFEKLDTRYKILREEGINEANANFEKYKTQSQANAKGRNLILVPAPTMLTLFSGERPHCLTKERARYLQSTFAGLRVSQERDHHSGCGSS